MGDLQQETIECLLEWEESGGGEEEDSPGHTIGDMLAGEVVTRRRADHGVVLKHLEDVKNTNDLLNVLDELNDQLGVMEHWLKDHIGHLESLKEDIVQIEEKNNELEVKWQNSKRLRTVLAQLLRAIGTTDEDQYLLAHPEQTLQRTLEPNADITVVLTGLLAAGERVLHTLTADFSKLVQVEAQRRLEMQMASSEDNDDNDDGRNDGSSGSHLNTNNDNNDDEDDDGGANLSELYSLRAVTEERGRARRIGVDFAQGVDKFVRQLFSQVLTQVTAAPSSSGGHDSTLVHQDLMTRQRNYHASVMEFQPLFELVGRLQPSGSSRWDEQGGEDGLEGAGPSPSSSRKPFQRQDTFSGRGLTKGHSMMWGLGGGRARGQGATAAGAAGGAGVDTDDDLGRACTSCLQCAVDSYVETTRTQFYKPYLKQYFRDLRAHVQSRLSQFTMATCPRVPAEHVASSYHYSSTATRTAAYPASSHYTQHADSRSGHQQQQTPAEALHRALTELLPLATREDAVLSALFDTATDALDTVCSPLSKRLLEYVEKDGKGIDVIEFVVVLNRAIAAEREKHEEETGDTTGTDTAQQPDVGDDDEPGAGSEVGSVSDAGEGGPKAGDTFVSNMLVQMQHIAAQRATVYIDEQVSWIESQRVEIRRAGLLVPVEKFYVMLDTLEHVRDGTPVNICSAAYRKLFAAITSWLEQAVDGNAKYRDVVRIHCYRFLALRLRALSEQSEHAARAAAAAAAMARAHGHAHPYARSGAAGTFGLHNTGGALGAGGRRGSTGASTRRKQDVLLRFVQECERAARDASQRYVRWSVSFAMPEFAAYMSRVEGLVARLGKEDLGIYVQSQELDDLRPKLEKSGVERAVSEMRRRAQKHFGDSEVDERLLADMWNLLSEYLNGQYGELETIAKDTYGRPLQVKCSVLTALLDQQGGGEGVAVAEGSAR